MYKKAAVTVTCDECQRAVENPYDLGTLWSGCHPLEGWYRLDGPLKTHMTTTGNPRRDFCSTECLAGWLMRRFNSKEQRGSTAS